MIRNYRSKVTLAALLALGALCMGAAPAQKRISIDVREADIHNVLRLLADTGHVNIVLADDIQGKVTLHLRDVPWTEALNVVLRAKGLGQERLGNIIHVDRLDRITKREQTQAELLALKIESAPLETVMIPIKYTTARSLEPIVRSLLTTRGKVIVDDRTNVLIVTDVARSIDNVKSTVGG